MGLSNSKAPSQLLHLKDLQTDHVPIIKRFTGGGTVFLNKDTFFVTFIFSHSFSPFLIDNLYPKAIMDKTADFYKKVFAKHFPFALKGNDYVSEDKKFGGNAQMISRNRYVHHTSFLWDFDNNQARYLKMPVDQPEYRLNRPHDGFLVGLNRYFDSKK